MGEQIDDDDFDGDWQPIISGEADFMSQYTVHLNVGQEVKEWLDESNVVRYFIFRLE